MVRRGGGADTGHGRREPSSPRGPPASGRRHPPSARPGTQRGAFLLAGVTCSSSWARVGPDRAAERGRRRLPGRQCHCWLCSRRVPPAADLESNRAPADASARSPRARTVASAVRPATCAGGCRCSRLSRWPCWTPSTSRSLQTWSSRTAGSSPRWRRTSGPGPWCSRW